MGWRGPLLACALLLAAAGAAALLLRPVGPPRGAPSAEVTGGATGAETGGGAHRPSSPGAGEGEGPTPPTRGPTVDLERALTSHDVEGARGAAASLRRSLRLDPAAFDDAVRLLLDPATDPVLRRALALILGTFGGGRNDAALLELLRRFPDDGELARCALMALGGTREPEEEDDVFDLGDRPWGGHGPGGLGITVRRHLDDPATRAAMSPWLGAASSSVRGAAAAALRHTCGERDVRDAFVAALSTEIDDGVLEVIGETLVGHAGRTADPVDRGEIVAGVLARAGAEEYHGLRFRVEDDFERVPLGPAEREVLATLASADHPFSIRSFAMTVVARSAKRSGAAAEKEAERLLGTLLSLDADPATRDLAARLLRRLPQTPSSTEALARAAGGDAAWNVRFTALETLASLGPPGFVEEVLSTASTDPDPRVAKRAVELLDSLRKR